MKRSFKVIEYTEEEKHIHATGSSRPAIQLHINNHNLTGKRHGLLTAIKPVRVHDRTTKGSAKKHVDIIWEIRCDCGNLIELASSRFVVDRTHCGCGSPHPSSLRKGLPGVRKYDPVEAAVSYAYSGYITKAKERGLSWDLSKDRFRSLITSDCHYCGSAPDRPVRTRTDVLSNECHLIRNGVDRIDSRQGYTPDNCVPCCTLCNQAKNDLEYHEFINLALRISKVWEERSV